jgi:hypothetical protein
VTKCATINVAVNTADERAVECWNKDKQNYQICIRHYRTALYHCLVAVIAHVASLDKGRGYLGTSRVGYLLS